MSSAQIEARLARVRRMFPTFLNVLRWRGWRVAGYMLLVLILLAGIADLIAGVYFGGKLRSELASLRAAGKPLTSADQAPLPVEEEENAFHLYMDAAKILVHPGNEDYAFGRQDRQWDDPEVLASIRTLVKQDQPALELVREAAKRPRCRSDMDWSDPAAALYSHLDSAHLLARFLASSAVVAAESGDQAEALERLRLGVVLARHMAEEPFLVSELVVIAIDTLTISAAQHVLAVGPLPEHEARRLAEELDRLDYAMLSQQAWEGERAFGLDGFRLAKRNRLLPYWVSVGGESRLKSGFWWAYAYPLRPWLYADELRYLAHMAAAEQALALPPHERARASILRSAIPVDERPPGWALVSRMLLPVCGAAEQKVLTGQAGRHLFRTAIGLERHRQQHGRYPGSLEELRKSGWDVPTDPFSGRDFVYRPAGNRYTLYSVGPNLQDDRGLVSIWPRSQHDRLPDGRKRVWDDEGDLVWTQ